MKEIELSFTVRIQPKQTDVHWIEEELLRLREEVFLGVLQKVMLEIEREVLKRERECERCGVILVRNGREGRRIKTLVGEVKVNRVRLRCQGCGQEVYPLDQAMGLGSGERMTFGVRERLLWAAVEVSYEKTHQSLEKFTGLEVSRNRIQEVVVEEGRRIEQWEEERRCSLFEEGQEIEGQEKSPEVLYIQVDGTAVNDRARGQWMECKVGASFSQRVKVSRDRVWLMDKRSYASIEGAEAFGEKFFLDCVRQGVLRAKEAFLIGDGASWIRALKENYFPEAIGVLDIWHLERELREALGEEKEWVVEALKELALQGRGSEILRRLMEEGTRVSEVKRRRRISEAMIYVRRDLDWIENIPKVEGYGSGPVEKKS